MSNDTRLRRLDAFFAERVLGCKIEYDNDGDPCCRCALDVLAAPHGQHDSDGPFWPEIQCYTRSLDAAWEGMQRIHLDYSEFRKVKFWDDTSDGSRPYHAEVYGSKGEGYACADHPAEALVLACLRAVGVEESELQ